MEKAAIILAAGVSKRMNTRLAKVLHEVAGRPLLIWAVEAARVSGAGRIIAIIGHQREIVRELLAARYGTSGVETVVQEQQKGTGHAVACALSALESEPDSRTVVILSGDANSLLSFAIVIGAVLLVGALDFAVFRNMDKLAKHLDPSRLAITEAVFGVLLAALAVQLMFDGLVELGIAGLTGH